MKKGTILYIMDPLCGWCYGFSPVLQQLKEKYAGDFDFRVVTGGMITGARVAPVAEMAGYILGAYKRVEEYTGVTFGEPYLDMLRKGTEISNSEPPCRAIYTFGQMQPEHVTEFAHEVQLALFVAGKSLNDDETYRELAAAFNIDGDRFFEKMNTEESRYGTQQDFQWAKAAGITGFPCTVLDTNGKYYMLAQGYRPLADVEQVLQSVLATAQQ
jgi:putative protein-disulfide isomerase